MTEYSVVSTRDIGTLEERVEAHLVEGWTPQGGVAMDSLYDPSARFEERVTEIFAQAMVR